ncbi:MAG: DUF1015 domain-containing protein [Pirellulaceae bacterium]|jgi:uncharacterized protein (DUF1015 family)|nr:DUF1015 domain-containing protein [Pirellulaceae bacterium]
MPQLHAFRGLRYDLGHVGTLSDVVAPPYDVIDPALQTALYQRHPANVIRLILNRPEPNDPHDDARYERAARFLRNWIREGVLSRDPDPAIYVYHQHFAHGGKECTRRGFMARVRLERFGEGNIYPHEETHAAAKADRLKLTLACRANLSQIFGLYPDPDNHAQELLEETIRGVAPWEATDHLGVVHRLWPVTDVKTIADVAAWMGPRPIFVADGHHRYETACNYRDLLAQQRTLPHDDPAHCVLMMCVSMSDPGMLIMPTHRLCRGLPPMTAPQLVERLGDWFAVEVAGRGPGDAASVWSDMEAEASQGTLGLYTAQDQQWVIARITQRGRRRMAEVAADHSSAWQGLGVAILHRLVIDTLLDAPRLPNPRYVHLVDEVVHGLTHGDDDGSEFPLAALVTPATVDHVREISEQGERMPAKSTYFYPKLLSGLVINPLDGD